jgi:hypothetical protein
MYKFGFPYETGVAAASIKKPVLLYQARASISLNERLT